MVKVGIVGVGNTIGIAQNHIFGYQNAPNATIVAIYDLKKERAQEYIERFSLVDAVACDTYEQLLDMVDAVSICTPNATHVPLSVQALEAGKHVLCEKPFAPTAAECEKAIAAAQKSGTVNMIGLCYRGIPAFRYLKQLADEGNLGQIYYVRASQGGGRIANPDVKCEWRMQAPLSGSGATADFGSHMVDMIDMLFRGVCGEIKEVQCMQGTFIKERMAVEEDVMQPVTNDDVGVFNMKMESGALVTCATSRVGCPHTIEVYCSEGYVGFNGDNLLELTVQLNGVTDGKREVIAVPEELYPIDIEMPDVVFLLNFYFEVRGFLDAIENGAPVETGFERGIYVQKILDALQLSADNKNVVAVNS